MESKIKHSKYDWCIPHTLMFTLTCTLEYTQTTQTEHTQIVKKKQEFLNSLAKTK